LVNRVDLRLPSNLPDLPILLDHRFAA